MAAEKRIALIGGSNCLIREGFGSALVKELSEYQVTNLSLGASGIVRALAVLTDPDFDLDRWDKIVVEYTLNDLIFEQGGSINPSYHRLVLSDLLRLHRSSGKIFVCALPNQTSFNKVLSRRSWVFQNYAELIETELGFGLDLTPAIAGFIETSQAPAFIDKDHLAPAIAKKAARQVAAAIRRPAGSPSDDKQGAFGRYQCIGDYRTKDGQLAETIAYETRVASASLVKIRRDCPIDLVSPGGSLMGFFTASGGRDGVLRVDFADGAFVKPFADISAANWQGRPYYHLRHLTVPRYFRKGEVLRLSVFDGKWDRPIAHDRTQAEIVPTSHLAEQEILLGSAVFRCDGTATIGY
ncbi:MAG: hypothetical protein ACWA49_05530 [Ruegeria sp.]